MLIFGTVLCIILFVILQTLIHEIQNGGKNRPNIIESNVSLSSLFSESVLETWIGNPPQSTAWKADNPTEATDYKRSGKPLSVKKNIQQNFNFTSQSNLSTPTPWEVQKDDSSSVSSKEYFVSSLFELPVNEVEADWPIVLGTFDHFDDENWKEFLIKTEVPFFIRMLLSDSSEVVKIRRISSKKKTNDKEKRPEKTWLSDSRMLIETSSWFLTHQSKFRLGKTNIEHDLDGTDSKNTFFFLTPRLLIHNKIKDKWRTSIIRHFDETGLNMTFVDRDRLVVARRYFHRIK